MGHHRNPRTKEFDLSEAYKHSLAEVRCEILKCVPLCGNACHRRRHAAMKQAAA